MGLVKNYPEAGYLRYVSTPVESGNQVTTRQGVTQLSARTADQNFSLPHAYAEVNFQNSWGSQMHAQKMSAVWSIVLLDCAFNPVQSPLYQRHVRNIVYQSCFVFLHFLLSFSWADSLRARWDLKKIAGYFVCIFVFSFKSWLSSLFFFTLSSQCFLV